ncbi:MAG TPA: FkbM family methyltransferase [Rariglobus sp.]|jgi:FkbM family methyltransferase|nr:FkbM family methyltransferase [Rariglobus sp.]
MKIKDIIKSLIPPLGLATYHHLVHGDTSKESPGLKKRHEAFDKWNNGCAGDEIVIRPDLKIKASPDALDTFRYFSYISEEMIVELDLFLRLTKNCRCLLDVGALHAIFSLAFTKRNSACRALALEPSPRSFQVILYNIYKNPDCKVTAVEKALGARKGKIAFHAEDFGVAHHFVADSLDSINKGAEIEVDTGDSITGEYGFIPDVIKIDVEGFEYECLVGLGGVLKAHRPLLFIEIHPDFIKGHGHSLASIWELLSEVGYTLYDSNELKIDKEAFVRFDDVERIVCSCSENIGEH